MVEGEENEDIVLDMLMMNADEFEEMVLMGEM